MRVCGVELSANDANIVLLNLDNGMFRLPECRTRKVSLQKAATAHELKYFQKTFAQLVQDYKIEIIVIRQRPMKGKFAGGAIGFKLEAALELLTGVEVIVMPPTEIKTALKESRTYIDFNDTGLKVFQKPAFETALAYINQHM
ncbi:DUF3010 family protein [Alteromonas confluentis]|uniref:DUF3010 domain-containing protein n=1 Tax=Alteromonas confluentis TaxID=1656094 RepID=A0A1E7ZA58_9ALTE|nr:DUF3010 family protein [Alteromonas confluentis]OFC70416.1 hypothetical protein BFC18_14730 [Alteromonas confluentis]